MDNSLKHSNIVELLGLASLSISSFIRSLSDSSFIAPFLFSLSTVSSGSSTPTADAGVLTNTWLHLADKFVDRLVDWLSEVDYWAAESLEIKMN